MLMTMHTEVHPLFFFFLFPHFRTCIRERVPRKIETSWICQTWNFMTRKRAQPSFLLPSRSICPAGLKKVLVYVSVCVCTVENQGREGVE